MIVLIQHAGPDKLNAPRTEDPLRQASGYPRRTLKRSSDGGIEHHGQLILIVRRDKVAAYQSVKWKRCCESCHSEEDHNSPVTQRPFEHCSITAVDPTEEEVILGGVLGQASSPVVFGSPGLCP